MKWLTKSDYLKFLIHPTYLWLQKHAKDKLPPFDEAAEAIVEQGNEIEAVARQLFDDGKMVSSLFAESVRETEGYVREGATTIFQASVLTERRLYARADVITKNSDGSWDLIEIKSATKEKDTYAHDLAFQKVAFEESGYKIRNTYLIHLNGYYVRGTEIDPQKLFTKVDTTAKVDQLQAQTKRGIEQALAIIALPSAPSDDPSKCKNWYAWRDIYRHLHPEIGEGSILNLTRLKPEQVKALSKLGITKIDDIPEDFELLPQQAAQIGARRAGKPVILPNKIAEHMHKLAFPLYFFDYETVGPGLPAYEGTRPYQQVPFQYSLHILREPGGTLEHREFLATTPENPMPALLTQMRADIGDEGSVVVWFKGFEGSVNEMMAKLYPEFKTFLQGANKRMYDLMEIFSNNFYSDARFMGSASIKKVLPVVVPKLSYANLEIQKGDVAQRQWERAAFGKLSQAAAAKIFEDLKVYCGQDTLAMVRIYEFLLRIRETTPGAQLSLLG